MKGSTEKFLSVEPFILRLQLREESILIEYQNRKSAKLNHKLKPLNRNSMNKIEHKFCFVL